MSTHIIALNQPEIVKTPQFDLLPNDGSGGDFRVILFNDDHHSMDEVVHQIIKATHCSPERAVDIMLKAHLDGQAVCFRGSHARCEEVADVLREIDLKAEVQSIG
jgi:ATP-dependent Clp protease adaptor protein ClpS